MKVDSQQDVSSSNKSGARDGNGVVVASAEDQRRINRFARVHKGWLGIKAELEALDNRCRDTQDACEEVELLDDAYASSIPYQLGCVFIHYDQESTVAKLTARKESLQAQISQLGEMKEEAEAEMQQLKAELYAKFGDRINLEMPTE